MSTVSERESGPREMSFRGSGGGGGGGGVWGWRVLLTKRYSAAEVSAWNCTLFNTPARNWSGGPTGHSPGFTGNLCREVFLRTSIFKKSHWNSRPFVCLKRPHDSFARRKKKEEKNKIQTRSTKNVRKKEKNRWARRPGKHSRRFL